MPQLDEPSRRLGSALRVAGSAMADLLFPQACGMCDLPISSGDGSWCPDCLHLLLKATRADYCPRCGASVGPYLLDPSGCNHCRQRRWRPEGLVRVGTYRGPIGDLVRKYKFARQPRLAGPLADLLAAAVQGRDWCGQIDAFVPVPTNWRGKWRYRFHPAGLLAGRLGRLLGKPALSLVRLRRKPRRQTELSPTDRLANVRNAFALRRYARVAGATLCVVDDVSTTGATLSEMVRILSRAGAAHVYAAILARTDPGEHDS